MMKIGFICHDAFPIAQPFHGGLEMITSILVHELVSRGHEVISLCVKGSELPGEMVHYSKIADLDAEGNQELLKLRSVSYSLINFLKQDFNVVQNHSLHYQSILFGNIVAQNFVTTFHTPVFEHIDVAIRSVVDNVDQTFVGVSNCISELYERTLPEVSTIYNGIDLLLWKYKYNSYENYYSWCGRICKEKGLAQLMGLCIRENIQLKIAGPISNTEYFESNIEPLLKLENFEYLGHLEQSSLNEMIRKSKAYIFSSVWEEPYGLVIAEALACGVPVIANTVGAAPEIITELCGCLFDLSNPTSFTDALSAADNLSRRDCRKRAENFCSHHKMVDSYESLYASLSGVYLEKAI